MAQYMERLGARDLPSVMFLLRGLSGTVLLSAMGFSVGVVSAGLKRHAIKLIEAILSVVFMPLKTVDDACPSAIYGQIMRPAPAGVKIRNEGSALAQCPNAHSSANQPHRASA